MKIFIPFDSSEHIFNSSNKDQVKAGDRSVMRQKMNNTTIETPPDGKTKLIFGLYKATDERNEFRNQIGSLLRM